MPACVLSPRVRKARLAPLVVMDYKVPWVCLAQLDHPEYLERMEIRCISKGFSELHAEPMSMILRLGFELCCNDVCLCRGRLENTVRKVAREEKESMWVMPPCSNGDVSAPITAIMFGVFVPYLSCVLVGSSRSTRTNGSSRPAWCSSKSQF